MPQVFISYTRAPSGPAAAALSQALRVAKLDVFKDNEQIHAGDRWLEKLDAALADCELFIVLVEPSGLERWTLAETLAALTRHVDSDRRPPGPQVPCAPEAAATPLGPRPRLLPVLMNGALPECLPGLLRQHQALAWRLHDNAAPPDELIEAARNALPTESAPPLPPDGQPFKGLLPFERSDQLWFFGRHADTLAALALLGNPGQHPPESGFTAEQQRRWLCITGASGSGKSSLMRAALVPLIQQGALWARTGLAHWTVAEPFSPGNNPVRKLAIALESAWASEPSQLNSDPLTQRLQADPQALKHWLLERQNYASGLRSATVLCIDQAEELFTQSPPLERERFARLLAAALAEPLCRCYLVMTIRSDHQHLLDELPELAALQNRLAAAYRLNPLDTPRLRQTIEGPARLAGLDVQELLPVLLEDARGDPQGALTLTQHALTQLYHARQGPRLSLALYRQQGGLAGMLRQQADQALGALRAMSPAHERGALALLRALCHYSPEGRHTRRHVSGEAALRQAGLGNVQRGKVVLEQLAQARLVVADGAPGADQRVDLVHETLLRCREDGQAVWPRLYQHLEATKDADWEREQLDRLGRQWAQAGWWQRYRMAYGVTRVDDFVRLRRLKHLADSSALRFLRASALDLVFQVGLLVAMAIVITQGAVWMNQVQGAPWTYFWRPTAWTLGLAQPWPETVNMPMPETGRFWMGCKPGRDNVNGITCNDDESPHEVPMTDPYALGRTEVSFLEYDFYVWSQHNARVTRIETTDNGSAALDYPIAPHRGRGHLPVVNISWYEARAYLQWLTTRRARAGQVFRLPSEAEWEYAARAENPSDPRSRPGPFWWGPSLPSESPALGEPREAVVVNCAGCAGSTNGALPVQTLPANPFGLHHMNGNVWEWTDSIYDPKEKFSEPGRVRRGGSWYFTPQNLRASYRFRNHPGLRNTNLGFRVCLSAPIRTVEAPAR